MSRLFWWYIRVAMLGIPFALAWSVLNGYGRRETWFLLTDIIVYLVVAFLVFGMPPDLAATLDQERALAYRQVYGLNTFDKDGDCKPCQARSTKLNRVGHCEPCQSVLNKATAKVPFD